jgi:hypothetical protein
MYATVQRNENPALRFILRAIGCLIVLATCLHVWIGPFPILPAAYGQIPDAGLQRKLILEEAIRTNQLLTEIKTLLAERTLNVRIQGADNPPDSVKPRG